jgi:putative DNA primase/helicase
VKRIETWASAYLGCEDTEYSRIAGRKWLLSAVARGMNPGCKVDTMIILEGAQGKGKSTAIAALVPVKSWFSDTPIPIGDKDGYVALKGKWIYEMSELASLRRADLDKAKAFFSSSTDSYRPPYGREMVAVPRSVVFAGSVNLGEYLQDSTGARRFWPLKCGTIDTTSLRDDRDQLWAEAVAVYNAWIERGSLESECLWYPRLNEVPMFEREQREREVPSPWAAKVGTWVESEKAKAILKKKGYLLIDDVASGALDIEIRDVDHSTHCALGVMMIREFGWDKKRVKVGATRTWGYCPKAV